MKLENIKQEICPVCGARAISESKKDQHTNGYFNESRGFSCGAVIRWSPNFKAERGSSKCPNLPEEVERKGKRAEAKEKLIKYIGRMDVDKDFMDLVSGRIEYL